MFRMKRLWFVPNLVKICSIFLKLQVVKKVAQFFWLTVYNKWTETSNFDCCSCSRSVSRSPISCWYCFKLFSASARALLTPSSVISSSVMSCSSRFRTTTASIFSRASVSRLCWIVSIARWLILLRPHVHKETIISVLTTHRQPANGCTLYSWTKTDSMCTKHKNR